MRYPINEEILFEIDLQIARKLYNRDRRIKKRDFKNAMRNVAKWGKPRDKRNFKRTGRARP